MRTPGLLRAMSRGWLPALFAAMPAAVQSQLTAGPVLVPGPCPAGAAARDDVDPSWVRCGTVTVPQNRADRGSKLAPVVLPVIVYETPTSRGRTPLVYLAGGPGDAAIDAVIEIFLSSPLGQLILRERPIIAFNQRGIGSKVSGGVPDLGVLSYRWRATRDESIATLVDSASKIHSRLRARGVRPEYFTTLHAAEDVPDVLRALGYQRMVLLGTSYGSKLALQVMRRYPELIEAAVLDGVATPQWTDAFDPIQADARRRALAVRLVKDCVQIPTCGAEYRGLDALADSLARPDAPPLHVVVHLPSAGGWFDLDLPRGSVLSVIGAFVTTDAVRAVPQLLEDLVRGDTLRRPLSPDLVLQVIHEAALARTAGPNYPVLYHTVVCGDIPAGAVQAGGRAVCDALAVPFGGPDAIAPVVSDVPTLLLSSGYDTQTPSSVADEAARTLSRSYQVLFSGAGHVAYVRPISAACVAVIVHAFLIDSARRPPDPCSKALLPSFLPRSTDLRRVPD